METPEGVAKVRVRHSRFYEGVAEPLTWSEAEERAIPHKPLPHGGRTEVAFYAEDESLIASATAECTMKDSYNKKLGRDIAYGRALKALKGAK